MRNPRSRSRHRTITPRDRFLRLTQGGVSEGAEYSAKTLSEAEGLGVHPWLMYLAESANNKEKRNKLKDVIAALPSLGDGALFLASAWAMKQRPYDHSFRTFLAALTYSSFAFAAEALNRAFRRPDWQVLVREGLNPGDLAVWGMWLRVLDSHITQNRFDTYGPAEVIDNEDIDTTAITIGSFATMAKAVQHHPIFLAMIGTRRMWRSTAPQSLDSVASISAMVGANSRHLPDLQQRMRILAKATANLQPRAFVTLQGFYRVTEKLVDARSLANLGPELVQRIEDLCAENQGESENNATTSCYSGDPNAAKDEKARRDPAWAVREFPAQFELGKKLAPLYGRIVEALWREMMPLAPEERKAMVTEVRYLEQWVEWARGEVGRKRGVEVEVDKIDSKLAHQFIDHDYEAWEASQGSPAYAEASSHGPSKTAIANATKLFRPFVQRLAKLVQQAIEEILLERIPTSSMKNLEGLARQAQITTLRSLFEEHKNGHWGLYEEDVAKGLTYLQKLVAKAAQGLPLSMQQWVQKESSLLSLRYSWFSITEHRKLGAPSELAHQAPKLARAWVSENQRKHAPKPKVSPADLAEAEAYMERLQGLLTGEGAAAKPARLIVYGRDGEMVYQLIKAVLPKLFKKTTYIIAPRTMTSEGNKLSGFLEYTRKLVPPQVPALHFDTGFSGTIIKWLQRQGWNIAGIKLVSVNTEDGYDALPDAYKLLPESKTPEMRKIVLDEIEHKPQRLIKPSKLDPPGTWRYSPESPGFWARFYGVLEGLKGGKWKARKLTPKQMKRNPFA